MGYKKKLFYTGDGIRNQIVYEDDGTTPKGYIKPNGVYVAQSYPAKKGQPGRRKGIPNHNTQLARDMFNKLLDNNLPKLQRSLEKVREDDPALYVDLVLKLAKFCVPTLKAVDVKAEVRSINIDFTNPDDL